MTLEGLCVVVLVMLPWLLRRALRGMEYIWGLGLGRCSLMCRLETNQLIRLSNNNHKHVMYVFHTVSTVKRHVY